MFLGSAEAATIRQLPQLGITSLGASPRVPTPTQGSVRHAFTHQLSRRRRHRRR